MIIIFFGTLFLRQIGVKDFLKIYFKKSSKKFMKKEKNIKNKFDFKNYKS